MRNLDQTTAYNLMVFMTDSTDHMTGKPGLTLTITASKAGAAFASITPTVTDRGSGWYSLALTTTHTDTAGDLALHITGTGADPTDLVSRVGAIAANMVQILGLPATAASMQDGTAQAGAASTITLVSGASATNDLYKGCLISLTGGTGAGQARTIIGYVGSTKIATVDRTWATNPDSTSTYSVLPGDGPTVDNNLGISISLAERNAMADVILSRDVASVEATMPEHCLGTVSLATTEWAIAGAVWTIYRTNGTTPFATKAITVTSGQITAVS